VEYSSANVLFQSNWTTALGATDAAIRDVNASFGPWDQWNDGSAGSLLLGAHIMEVVSGIAPPGYSSSLQVQQRGGCADCWADVRKNPFIATANADYYLRYYFMTRDTNGIYQDHGVEPWTDPARDDLLYLDKNEGLSGWGLNVTVGHLATDGHGGSYPFFNWFLRGQVPGTSLPSEVLSYDTWYRFEYWVHFTSPGHIQVHPRIYDATGTLLYQDADFWQEDYQNPALRCGHSQWTLADWYSLATTCNPGNDFQIQNVALLQRLLMGNNGSASQPAGATTGRFWYYSGVEICANTWCGP